MRNCDIKFTSEAWGELKNHLLQHNVIIESLYICCYYHSVLNRNDILCRCILNALETEPIPAELSGLDALRKQLIQRAKSFQMIVRLGMYIGKVPG